MTATEHSTLTEKEWSYLGSQLLGRLATVTPKGRPHVIPVGITLNDVERTIELGMADLPERGQNRFWRRNVESNPWIALVVDDHTSMDPFTPRGIELRGRAEIFLEGGERLMPGSGPVWVRVVPSWATSWGIETHSMQPPLSRRLESVPAAGGHGHRDDH